MDRIWHLHCFGVITDRPDLSVDSLIYIYIVFALLERAGDGQTGFRVRKKKVAMIYSFHVNTVGGALHQSFQIVQPNR